MQLAGVVLPWRLHGRTAAHRSGLGAFIKVEVRKQLDLWLESRDNLERWESNALTASDRRVLLTKWVATAVHTVDSRAGCRFCLFAKTGSLMTTDGTGDE